MSNELRFLCLSVADTYPAMFRMVSQKVDKPRNRSLKADNVRVWLSDDAFAVASTSRPVSSQQTRRQGRGTHQNGGEKFNEPT
jgi:hypothetical protein